MLDGTVLDQVSCINDLGFIIDEKMTFLDYVYVMVAKAFVMLGFIKRLFLYSKVSLHVSGSSKTVIHKLHVEPVL
jgi:hypothetical protein